MKKESLYFLNEFEELKRNFGETVSDFIKRFNKLYHKMPPDCKPPVAATKSRFSKAFVDDFFVILRERTSRTLEDMQINSIKVEANRATLATLKAKEENAQRKLKSSQEASTSSKTKTEDSKIDEITSLLINLSNRISKVETQPRTVQQTVCLSFKTSYKCHSLPYILHLCFHYITHYSPPCHFIFPIVHH